MALSHIKWKLIYPVLHISYFRSQKCRRMRSLSVKSEKCQKVCLSYIKRKVVHKYNRKTSLLQERPFNCFTNNWDTSFYFFFFSSSICLTWPPLVSIGVIKTKYRPSVNLIMKYYQMRLCRISSSPLEVISLFLVFFDMAPPRCFWRYHDFI